MSLDLVPYSEHWIIVELYSSKPAWFLNSTATMTHAAYNYYSSKSGSSPLLVRYLFFYVSEDLGINISYLTAFAKGAPMGVKAF